MPEQISHPGSTKGNICKLHNRNQRLWQFVLLLVVLVAVTVALVVTFLYRFIHRSDYQISLYQGLVSASQEKTPVQSHTALKNVVGSSTAELSASQAKDFDFQVSDEENVWSTNTTIELFRTSYANDNGEITVQSADADKVVAPGTGGSYTFSLKNASKLDSNYQIWLEADMSVSSSQIPIQFRIFGADGWLTGNDGSWLTAKELNQAVERKNLYAGKSTEYTLYWRWAFERGEDEEDTSYGNVKSDQEDTTGGSVNVSQSVSCQVTLHTLAAEGLIENDGENPVTFTPAPGNPASYTGSDPSEPETREDTVSREATKTADTTPVQEWFLLIGVAGVTILSTGILLLLRRKQKRQRIEK